MTCGRWQPRPKRTCTVDCWWRKSDANGYIFVYNYIYTYPQQQSWKIWKIWKILKDIERWSNCENSSLYSIAVSWSSGALHRRQRKPRVQARLDIGGKGMLCAEISHVGRQSLAAFPTLQAANIYVVSVVSWTFLNFKASVWRAVEQGSCFVFARGTGAAASTHKMLMRLD